MTNKERKRRLTRLLNKVDPAKLTERNLRMYVRDLARIANRRLEQLQKEHLTSFALMELGDRKVTAKGKDRAELIAEFNRIRKFLKSSGSSVKGARREQKEIFEKAFEPPEPDISGGGTGGSDIEETEAGDLDIIDNVYYTIKAMYPYMSRNELYDMWRVTQYTVELHDELTYEQVLRVVLDDLGKVEQNNREANTGFDNGGVSNFF